MPKSTKWFFIAAGLGALVSRLDVKSLPFLLQFVLIIGLLLSFFAGALLATKEFRERG